jgi:lipooligosaccharide transport system permease protein
MSAEGALAGAAVQPPVRRVRRLEPAALAAVMSRDVVIFGRYWKSTTFSSVVQPTIYLLAFGLGLRSFVKIGHLGYVEYVGTGVVATAVLFSSAFPGMFNTFVRWQFQRTYDAMLAAPVDVEELITAEVLWISVRAGVYGLAPLIVAIAFGLEPEFGMLLVPLIGFITGFGFAAFGVTVAAVAKTIDNFNYVTSAVLTPMFLVAGTFLPDLQPPRRRSHSRSHQPPLPLRPARPRRVPRRHRRRRPRPRGRLARVRAPHVAPRRVATRQTPHRLAHLQPRCTGGIRPLRRGECTHSRRSNAAGRTPSTSVPRARAYACAQRSDRQRPGGP